jgi:hypothetical protein
LDAEQKRHQQQHFANGVNSSSSSGNNSSNSNSCSGNNSSTGYNSSNSSSGINSSNSSCGSSSTSYGGSSEGPIMVRLLLAIDRRRLEDMEDTVQLLLKLREAAFLLLPENFRTKSGDLMPIRIRILTQV